MHTIQNTLYVMTPQGYAHLENATVRIDVEREKKLQVPLHHVGGLVCFGNIMISPALMHRLADEQASPDLTVGRGLKPFNPTLKSTQAITSHSFLHSSRFHHGG